MNTNIEKNTEMGMAESAEMLADALAYSVLLRKRQAAGETIDPEILEVVNSMAMNALNCYWVITGVKVRL